MPRIVNHQCVVTYQQNHLRIIISQPLLHIFGKCDFAVRLTIFWSCWSCYATEFVTPSNIVTANFCEVEPAVNLFLSLLQAPLIKIKAQFLLWQRFCQNYSDVVVWKRAYKLCQRNIFPAIKILLSILATLPASSATAERSFSTLLLIKSDLRTTMGQARLDGLCVMHILNDISISTGAIIKKFAATSREIKL